ncbi:MAG: hypothetical protein AAFV80_09210, partial [Bacteroidota bacterium]
LEQFSILKNTLKPECILVKNSQLLSKCNQTKLWAYIKNETTVLHHTRPPISRLILTANACPMELNQKGLLTDALFEALWFQLIPMPSLNGRRADLPAIIEYYTAHFSKLHQKPGLRISASTSQFLVQYTYTQHFLELADLLERAVLLSRGKTLYLPEEKLARAANRKFKLSPWLWVKRSS